MYPWRVMIECRNLRLELEGEIQWVGAFSPRFVEAEDEEGARSTALRAVRELLAQELRNDPEDPPRFTALEVEALESPEDIPYPEPGFTLFLEGAEAAPDFVPDLPVDPSFQLARGCSVTDLGGVTEGFDVLPPDEHGASLVRVNVSAERLSETYLALAEAVRPPGFFILETPSPRAVEEELRASEDDPYHVDTHYLDGLQGIDHRLLFEPVAELLTHCGTVCFGFGSHEVPEQVLVDGFKCMTVRTADVQKFKDALEGLGYSEQTSLRTLRDTFGPDTPGEIRRVRVDGRTVFELVDELAERGLYFARRREGTV